MAQRSIYTSQEDLSPRSTKPYVIVIFGRTGVGITSLVDLIAGYPISSANADAKSTAQRPRPHKISLPRSCEQYEDLLLYEVPGFRGDVPDEAILDKIRQIERHEGIDLFIHCLRKQKKTVLPKEIVRPIRDIAQVPMIAVVTELEHGKEMDEWWATNGTMVEEMCFGSNDRFDAHVCITTLPRRDVDLSQSLRKRRDRSEERIRELVLAQCRRPKRAPDPPSGCFGCLRALFG